MGTGRAATVTYRVTEADGNGAVTLTVALSNRAEWTRARFKVAAAVLAKRFDMDAPARHRAAALACVVWALETGWGESEHRGNVGNITCTASASDTGCCMRVPRHVLRAYSCSADRAAVLADAPPAGVLAFWTLVSRRYPLAWDLFQRGAANAPEELYLGGWATSPPSSAELDSLWRMVRSHLAAVESEGWDGFRLWDARRIDEPGETPADASDGATDDPGSAEDYGDDGGGGEGLSLWVALFGVGAALASESK